MTDDPDLGRLLAAVERAGAKLVMIGDDRQLGAVGPGGGLGALRRRQLGGCGSSPTTSARPTRANKQALVELRAGRVDRAVDWYAAAGRVVQTDSREDAIVAMVDAWAADITAGREALAVRLAAGRRRRPQRRGPPERTRRWAC